MRSTGFLFLFILMTLTFGCTRKSAEAPQVLTGEALVARGKTIYDMNCLACHNADPAKDGTVGPAVMNSDLELLRQRILHASYPPGYKPKRDTRAMVAMPHLEKELEAMQAYLNSTK